MWMITGLFSAKEVVHALREDTTLVSVMTGNNEIGTIEPIADIGAQLRARGIAFHTDAVQAVGPDSALHACGFRVDHA